MLVCFVGFFCLWQNFAIRCWIHSKWTIQWERDRRRRCKTINCCKRGQTTQSSEEGFVTFFFFLLVCSSALLRLKSYSAAVTFLNSSLAVDFCAFCHRKSLPIWLVSSVETEELHIPFIPASFWNKRLSRNESCLLLSHAHPQQNSFQLGLIVSLMVPELPLHGQ